MRQSKLPNLLVPCWFCFVACGSSDPEPPLTPASYELPPSTATTSVKRTAPPPPQKPPPVTAEAPPPEASPPVVTGIEGGDSRTAIAMARCQREARCGNVGQEKDYETEDDCVTRLEPGTERELDAHQCPNSIAPVPLTACLDAIRRQSCDRPLGDLAPISECNAAALCKD
jgi:hypothetical protein